MAANEGFASGGHLVACVDNAACREAEAVLLDQRYFQLDEKAFKKFTAALDKPPAQNARLRKLFSAKAPWD